MEGTVIWRGNATHVTLVDGDIEAVWTPKIAIFSSMYVGFGAWNDHRISERCEGLFRAWQAMQLLHQVQRVHTEYNFRTVGGLVAALDDRLDDEGWCLLAEDFGMSETGLRQLLVEAESLVPSVHELLDMWARLSVYGKIKYLPELEEELESGRMERHVLIDNLIEASRKEIDKHNVIMRRLREKERAERERVSTPETSLFQFLRDIGVTELAIPRDAHSGNDKFSSFSRDEFDKMIVNYLTDGAAPAFFELWTIDREKREQPYVQLVDGRSARLPVVKWDGVNREYRVHLMVDGRDTPDIVSIATLRTACGMASPGRKAPWLPSFWRRLFSGR